MANTDQLATDSQTSLIKLKNALEALSIRADGTSNIDVLLSEAMASFQTFFSEVGDPEFKPSQLLDGDTARSEIYNLNLRSIYNDLSRFYQELTNLVDAQIKSYNYSQVIITELKKRAESIGSIVLDLNILNNFTRGDVLVAGDDFLNTDRLDKTATTANIAELISNGAGIALARNSVNNLITDPRVKIDILPISPKTASIEGTIVNTKPTPGNLNRFYEGNYYNMLGAARPEGGEFNIQFIVDPKNVQAVSDTDTNIKGIYLEYGASDEAKIVARRKMTDNNPDTFWECEYVIKPANPLIPDVTEALIITDNAETPGNDIKFSDPEAPSTAAIQIDINELNDKAITYDTLDLVIDIIVTLPEDTSINFVNINPILYSNQAFIDVLDIATASSEDSNYLTVDGWSTIRFGKSLTPEINEYLSDSQLSATLAPNRSNYVGQGVFPFPSRIANSVKIRLAMKNPTSQVYEVTYALLKNDLNVKITTTTTTTKGALRF